YSERNLLTCRLLDVQKVDVDALGRFWTKVHYRCRVLDRAHERLEHQIELARFAERSLHPAGGALRIRRTGRAFDSRIIGAKPLLAVLAIHQRIHEAGDVPASFPDSWMHEYRGVQPFD